MDFHGVMYYDNPMARPSIDDLLVPLPLRIRQSGLDWITTKADQHGMEISTFVRYMLDRAKEDYSKRGWRPPQPGERQRHLSKEDMTERS